MSDRLEDWRKQIDAIDEKMLNLLAKRVSLVRKIGQYKKEHHLFAFDERRWNKILTSNLLKAQSLNLSKNFVKKLFALIHKYSLVVQKDRS